MAEPVGSCQCSPLRFERAEKRAALAEPASPLPAAKDMKREHPKKEIWLRAKGEMPSFTISPRGQLRRAHHVVSQQQQRSSEDRSCYCFEALDRLDRLVIALFGNRGTT
jgi:hypothetical protein